MAIITVSEVKKYSSGDQIKVVATVTSLANTNTYIVPHIRNVQDWSFTCTTDDSAGGTIAGTLTCYGK